MKKKIVATVVLAGVLVTGAFAYNQNCQNGGQRGMHKGQFFHQGMQQHGMSKGMMNQGQNMHRKGMSRYGGMQMFSNLDLNKDQQFKLSILRDEMRLEMRKMIGGQPQSRMLNFIGDDGFDKKAFLKEVDSKQTKMMEIKANHMEKVFKILTKEQIVELKKNLSN